MTRQQLMEQRDNLKKKLNEVQEQLNNFDIKVYGGKMAKAIKLLSECLEYLSYPTVPLKCSECEKPIEIDLDEVIEGLRILYTEEF